MQVKSINDFKQKIQLWVNNQKVAPTPEAVLDHLLGGYLTILGVPGTNFFKSLISSHSIFVEKLRSNLMINEIVWMGSLDNYLQNTILDQGGDFFSLLIAYFYYYGHSDISKYQNIKKQLLVPLCIYQKKIKKIEFNSFCLLNNSQGNLSVFAELSLRYGIDKSFADRLIRFIVNQEIEYGCISFDSVCYALSQLSIPKEQEELLIDAILVKLEQHVVNKVQSSALWILSSMSIPQTKHQKVRTALLEIIVKDRNEEFFDRNKSRIWEILGKIGIADNNKNELIQKQLDIFKKIAHQSKDFIKNSLKVLGMLACMNDYVGVPNDLKKKIIEWMLSHDLAIHLPAEIPNQYYEILVGLTPENLKYSIFQRLIDHYEYRRCQSSALISAFKKLNISEVSLLNRLISKFIEIITNAFNNDTDFSYDIDIICSIKIPDDRKPELREALLGMLARVSTPYPKILRALRNVGLEKVQFEPVREYFLKTKDQKLISQAYNELARMEYPKEWCEQIINELLASVNDLCETSEVLADIELTPSECEHVTHALINDLVKTVKTLPDKPNARDCEVLHKLIPLIKLQRFTNLDDTITLRVKLESLLPLIPKIIHLGMAPWMRNLEDLCEIKKILSQKLPGEMVLEVLKYHDFSR